MSTRRERKRGKAKGRPKRTTEPKHGSKARRREARRARALLEEADRLEELEARRVAGEHRAPIQVPKHVPGWKPSAVAMVAHLFPPTEP